MGLFSKKCQYCQHKMKRGLEWCPTCGRYARDYDPKVFTLSCLAEPRAAHVRRIEVKMFCSMDEAKLTLNRNEQEVMQLVTDGILPKYQDGERIVFKSEDVARL